MVKDFRYILKRILIGVGVILVMSFIRSCNVKAATYNMPYQDITINNSNWFSTYGYYGTTFSTSGTSINFDIYANESSYDFAISQATAVVMDVCVSTGFSQVTRTADFGVVYDSEGVKASERALNDIVISRRGSLQINKLRIYVNGQFLKDYDADGVIVTTPTGSTGYN